MGDVVDADPVLLGHDLVLEILHHAVEIGDHHVQLRHLATLLVDLEPLEANETVSGLHDSVLPMSEVGSYPTQVAEW